MVIRYKKEGTSLNIYFYILYCNFVSILSGPLFLRYAFLCSVFVPVSCNTDVLYCIV